MDTKKAWGKVQQAPCLADLREQVALIMQSEARRCDRAEALETSQHEALDVVADLRERVEQAEIGAQWAKDSIKNLLVNTPSLQVHQMLEKRLDMVMGVADMLPPNTEERLAKLEKRLDAMDKPEHTCNTCKRESYTIESGFACDKMGCRPDMTHQDCEWTPKPDTSPDRDAVIQGLVNKYAIEWRNGGKWSWDSIGRVAQDEIKRDPGFPHDETTCRPGDWVEVFPPDDCSRAMRYEDIESDLHFHRWLARGEVTP